MRQGICASGGEAQKSQVFPSAPKPVALFLSSRSLQVHRQSPGPTGRRINGNGRRELQPGLWGECGPPAQCWVSSSVQSFLQSGLMRTHRLLGVCLWDQKE